MDSGLSRIQERQEPNPGEISNTYPVGNNELNPSQDGLQRCKGGHGKGGGWKEEVQEKVITLPGMQSMKNNHGCNSRNLSRLPIK